MDPLELQPTATPLDAKPDKRPHMPEPPPVRLVAVEDVRAAALAGQEKALDDFYVDMLCFERDDKDDRGVVYKAENAKLIFELVEQPIERGDMRPIGVETPSLPVIENRIIDRELEYQRVRGLPVAQEALLVQDPAGNWVSITEFRGVM